MLMMVRQLIGEAMPAHILTGKSNHSPEIKQGQLNIINGNRKLPVQVKVYSSNFGHYAVFYQDKKISRPCGFVNLKHCTIERKSESCFSVVSQNSDGQSTTLGVNNVNDLMDWVSAMRSNTDLQKEYDSVTGTRSPLLIPRTPLMPTLEESEEEETEEE